MGILNEVSDRKDHAFFTREPFAEAMTIKHHMGNCHCAQSYVKSYQDRELSDSHGIHAHTV